MFDEAKVSERIKKAIEVSEYYNSLRNKSTRKVAKVFRISKAEVSILLRTYRLLERVKKIDENLYRKILSGKVYGFVSIARKSNPESMSDLEVILKMTKSKVDLKPVKGTPSVFWKLQELKSYLR